MVSTLADLPRSICAYPHLLQAKENAGLERTIGAAGFAARRFDLVSRTPVVELIDR